MISPAYNVLALKDITFANGVEVLKIKNGQTGIVQLIEKYPSDSPYYGNDLGIGQQLILAIFNGKKIAFTPKYKVASINEFIRMITKTGELKILKNIGTENNQSSVSIYNNVYTDNIRNAYLTFISSK